MIKVPSVWGDDVHEKWVYPKGIYSGNGVSFFALPNAGDGVWVSFENGDAKFPVWEYGWWGKTEVPDAVKENYPQKQVWQSGTNRVELDEKEGLFRVVTQSGTTIEVNKDGVSLGKATASSHPAAHGDTTADLIKELTDLLIEAKVSTAIGLQPLANILPKLATFKEKVDSLKSNKVTLE
jgi:uncharacterized protein involved in type VI secretion and phage assembly